MGVHVLRRLAGGEWGAYLVSTAAGALAVLKPLPVHEIFAERPVRLAVGYAERLRDGGYPIPRLLGVNVVSGRVCTLQEYVDADVPSVLTLPHARRMVGLHRRHRGQATPDPGWGQRLAASLADPKGADQRKLREAGDPAIGEILAETLAVGARTDPAAFRAHRRADPRGPVLRSSAAAE